ncbi:Zinc finger matrin-type protein 4 [Takifugu flavidus]|uniref:Zinc finger matrin-type protein 4 n=1 Tax=Takifugu flavidus TaxID=433684 RepID=A0A5C6PGK2_9TELE|nr:Zinc finger matrin-type protein 4 [Takifugu flavidus]
MISTELRCLLPSTVYGAESAHHDGAQRSSEEQSRPAGPLVALEVLSCPSVLEDYNRRLADGCQFGGEPEPPRKSQMKMKSADVVDGGLFTESYCNICNAQLISESQRTAHYEEVMRRQPSLLVLLIWQQCIPKANLGLRQTTLFACPHWCSSWRLDKRPVWRTTSKKHANKVRLFYMLHPKDGGPPSKRLRPDNPCRRALRPRARWGRCAGSTWIWGNFEDCAETEVDRNKCCTLCNMFFTSAIVAQSHYQGKTHAKRVRLVLGEPPSLSAVASLTDADSPQTPVPTDPSACPPTSPALPFPVAVVGGNGGREAGKYCCLCGAWFNNPLMAQQHYEGKKHRRNAARARLLEQLAGSLDATECTGLRSSYSCSVCNVVLNSIEQYHAHLQGSKHQNKPQGQEVGDGNPFSLLLLVLYSISTTEDATAAQRVGGRL